MPPPHQLDRRDLAVAADVLEREPQPPARADAVRVDVHRDRVDGAAVHAAIPDCHRAHVRGRQQLEAKGVEVDLQRVAPLRARVGHERAHGRGAGAAAGAGALDLQARA